MENKTIEERKKECATKYYEEYHDSAIAVGIEKGYEIGATEQEAITKKEMIEKAKKATCDNCYQYYIGKCLGFRSNADCNQIKILVEEMEK